MPDFYQGTELWDLTLVDPDNRRPIDFDLRCRMARELDPLVREARAGDTGAAPRVRELLDAWPDGRIKLFTTLAALGLRREKPDLFLGGSYVPLRTSLPPAAEAIAFERHDAGGSVIAIAPTLTRAIAGGHFAVGQAWAGGRVDLPAARRDADFLNVLTGERAGVMFDETGPYLRLADLLRTLPIALLISP